MDGSFGHGEVRRIRWSKAIAEGPWVMAPHISGDGRLQVTQVMNMKVNCFLMWQR